MLRHADATEVAIVLRMTPSPPAPRNQPTTAAATRRRRPVGRGSGAESDGNGLINMARRAEALGGVFGIAARDGAAGTVVTATIPLGWAA